MLRSAAQKSQCKKPNLVRNERGPVKIILFVDQESATQLSAARDLSVVIHAHHTQQPESWLWIGSHGKQGGLPEGAVHSYRSQQFPHSRC